MTPFTVSRRRPARLIALMTAALMGLMAVGLAQPAQATGAPGLGDASFNSHFGFPAIRGLVNAVAIAGDGKFLVGGSITGKLVKVNTDGTTTGSAATFNSNVGSALDGMVNAITVLSNGQIVVEGNSPATSRCSMPMARPPGSLPRSTRT